MNCVCAVKAPALVATGLNINVAPSDTEEDNTEVEASTASSPQLPPETATVSKTPSPVNADMLVDSAAATSVTLTAVSKGTDNEAVTDVTASTQKQKWDALCSQVVRVQLPPDSSNFEVVYASALLHAFEVFLSKTLGSHQLY